MIRSLVRPRHPLAVLAAGLLVTATATVALGQAASSPASPPPPAPAPSPAPPAAAEDRVWVVMPQRPVPRSAASVGVASVDVKVTIDGPVATTTMRVGVSNTTGRAAEAELVLPVPDGAAIRGFGLEGVATDSDGQPTAELMPRAEARRIYNAIVRRMIDPGLLEFAGYGLIKSSVFPVPAGGAQFFNVTYEHVMPTEGTRRDYVLPRSEALDQIGAAWSLEIDLRQAGTGAIYSPSHEVTVRRSPDGRATIAADAAAMTEPGAFRLSVVEAADGQIPMSIVGYPDPTIADGSGGYLLLVTGAPLPEADPERVMRREVTIVIDRSGSMRGPKIEQARSAALQVIEALDEGESFRIIDYADTIETFGDGPIEKNSKSVAAARLYLGGIKALGGTNIHDAVVEALRPAPAADTLPMVLFLTDGLPTIGQRSESAIRNAAKLGNAHARRLFTFGVGFDVNAPLLTGLARDSRAVSSFVLPNEDLEVKVAGMFRKLGGPVLAQPTLRIDGMDDALAAEILREVMPNAMPDLFEGDQLVVLARYTTNEPFRVSIAGQRGDDELTISANFDPAEASTRHAFVPRLWAQRRIASLIEQVRLSAAEPGGGERAAAQELIDEIVHLSLEHGILTEYTAFLAADPADAMAFRGAAGRPAPGAGGGGGSLFGGAASASGVAPSSAPVTADEAAREARARVLSRAAGARTGSGAVNQELNTVYLYEANTKMAQRWLDEDMGEVTATTCQIVGDKSLFRREQRWVDTALIARCLEAEDDAAREAILEPDETVEFGTDAYMALVDELIDQGRQSLLTLRGDVLVDLDGRSVLVRNPA